jgi:hypothetical protein
LQCHRYVFRLILLVKALMPRFDYDTPIEETVR